ncbi:phosphatidate cytidylyltransferase [Cerasicoccus frondis]|uniref:phosphatidate cytidylyltransferase n=1 Tax=Cerasicoccus frondis TaxID=490090 RepID=UPI002852AB12|nr:phosphatidate cytidylyltransferase [Cerasicoccus frondis]
MNFWTPPTTNLLITAGVVFALLIFASISIRILKLRNPQKDYLELTQRTQSWWVICVLFMGAILLSGVAGLLLFAFISYLALKEYFSLIPTRRVDRRVLFWAYLAIPIQYFWIYIGWYGMFIIFIPVYMFLIVPIRLVSLQETSGFLRSVGAIHWGLMVTVFCLSHAAWLFVLPQEVDAMSLASGAGMVLFLVGITELNDIAQFLWGKSLGKRKIIPGVSPNKTWAGFLGGVGTSAVLGAILGPQLTPLSCLAAFFIGGGIGVFGFLGDVTVSALKRDLGIKDSGSILPGHGGVLDRIDSLMFTAPLFLHCMRYFYF